MWWRILTFCLLVSLILMVVLSYIHGRPVVHLFFKRCCDDDIENEEVIFENFANNFLRERLMAFEIVESNGTFVPSDADVLEVIDMMREKMNVHNPESRRNIKGNGENTSDNSEIDNSTRESVTERKMATDHERMLLENDDVTKALEVTTENNI